ncbi:hypothetical protein [Flavobacterium sp.]|uniref:hypothetical protein n=1 Tax=Flavobacterium sp. TaxID=239 RepID=UPI002ED807B1
MTERNKNNKREKPSIKNRFNIILKNDDSTIIPFLYGMTVEEYKEGVEIHSKCFDQIKMVKVLSDL